MTPSGQRRTQASAPPVRVYGFLPLFAALTGRSDRVSYDATAMNGKRRPRSRPWVAAVAPAVIVTVPLAGFAFYHDERRKVYAAAADYGKDPLESFRYGYYSIEPYLKHGNFRPVGRVAESLEHGFVFDAAEATGLAPHAVHGAVRLVMVALVAAVAARVVSALARSAGTEPHRTAMALFPLVLGTTLVANNPGSPLINFPFVFMGAAALILVICLSVARDHDMAARPLRVREVLTMGLLGAVAASTYDLVYVAPAIAAAFLAARATASDMPFHVMVRTAAARRWVALVVGFLAVLIPSRIAIATHCVRGETCYAESDIRLSSETLSVAVGRLLTGAPPTGWVYTAREAALLESDFTLAALLHNTLWTMLLAGVVVVAVRAAIDADPGRTAAMQLAPSSSTDDGGGWLRLSAALVMLGAATACSAALVAGLSRHQQTSGSRIGGAWRETLLTQVGWSFMITAALAAIFALGTTQAVDTTRRTFVDRPLVLTSSVAAALGVCLALTLLANAQIGEIYRHDPLASVVSQISEATISLDTTDAGNERRCSLIYSYTKLTPPGAAISGRNVREHLDDLMLARHGWPFCVAAGRVSGYVRDATGGPVTARGVSLCHEEDHSCLHESSDESGFFEFHSLGAGLYTLSSGESSRCVTVAEGHHVHTNLKPRGDQGGFIDVPEDAYYSRPVMTLAERGLFAGTEWGDGFCPDAPIDRKTVAVWIVRFLDGKDPEQMEIKESRGFDDVDSGGFHAPFIERLAELGVTRGCGDGDTFCPAGIVNHAEMAVFLSRALQLANAPDPGFVEVSSDAWYITRAQVATFLARATELVEAQEPRQAPTSTPNTRALLP